MKLDSEQFFPEPFEDEWQYVWLYQEVLKWQNLCRVRQPERNVLGWMYRARYFNQERNTMREVMMFLEDGKNPYAILAASYHALVADITSPIAIT